MSVQDITELLKNTLFKTPVPCGPGLKYSTFFPAVQDSTLIAGTKIVVPDQCYHPDVKVAFDFESTYTQTTVGETSEQQIEIEPQRLVEPNTLKSVCTSIAQFVYYYFEYTMTYGSSDDDEFSKSSIVEEAKKAVSSNNEFAMNSFLNKIVNYFLAEITINRSRNQVGNCTLSIKENRVAADTGVINYLFWNIQKAALTQLFVPMLPMTVWARGRFYKDWYFPIFTGYVTRVGFQNAQGFAFITVESKDVLELARVSYEMTNPSVIQSGEFKKQDSSNFNTKPFYGIDHMAIFHGMFHGGALVEDEVSGQRTIKQNYKEPGVVSFNALAKFDKSTETEGVHRPYEVVEDNVVQRDLFSIDSMILRLKRPKVTVSWGYNISPERVFNLSSPEVFNSVFLSRLDVLRETSSSSFFELYVDGHGNVHYHPLRLGNDFLIYDIFYPTDKGESRETSDTEFGNLNSRYKTVGVTAHQNIFPGAQVITVDESLNSSKNLNIEELTTHYILLGQPPFESGEDPRLLDYYGDAIDVNAMARFGYRRKVENNRYFNLIGEATDSEGNVGNFFNLAANALLRYSNALLYTRSDEVVFRPELEVALPIYLPDEKEVFYIDSITHNIRIGDTATTTISSTFGRHFDEPPCDILSFIVAQDRILKNSVTATQVSDLTSLKGVVQYQAEVFGVNFPDIDKWVETRGSIIENLFSYIVVSKDTPSK